MKVNMQNFTGDTEESSWPRLEVNELSDYVHENEITESTFRQMLVPQGPGASLEFLGSFHTEESTCFTPNFMPAQTTQQTITDTQ